MREKIHISNCNIGNDSINILIGVIELYVLFFFDGKKNIFISYPVVIRHEIERNEKKIRRKLLEFLICFVKWVPYGK